MRPQHTPVLFLSLLLVACGADDSDTADWEDDVLCIKITLRRAVSGKQLGLPQVINMSKAKNRQTSLGSLIAMGKHFRKGQQGVFVFLRNRRRGKESHPLRLAHV